jgi:molecular chaperone GrpE
VSKKKHQHEMDEKGEAATSAAGEQTPTAVPEVVPAEQPAVEEALAASQAEAQKNWDLYLRARADLENYRKRAQREKEDLSRFANENLLREILPVVDNLERALEHARQGDGGNGGLLQGVEMTLGQFQRVLEKFGVTPLRSVGEPFDPARHEALGQVESAECPPNTVVQELQRGYLLNDRLLRPAMVMVAKAPPVAAEPQP